jgi:hypothetical protein
LTAAATAAGADATRDGLTAEQWRTRCRAAAAAATAAHAQCDELHGQLTRAIRCADAAVDGDERRAAALHRHCASLAALHARRDQREERLLDAMHATLFDFDAYVRGCAKSDARWRGGVLTAVLTDLQCGVVDTLQHGWGVRLLLSRSFVFSFILLPRWCECSCHVHLCSLHTKSSRSICNFTNYSGGAGEAMMRLRLLFLECVGSGERRLDAAAARDYALSTTTVSLQIILYLFAAFASPRPAPIATSGCRSNYMQHPARKGQTSLYCTYSLPLPRLVRRRLLRSYASSCTGCAST